MNSICRFSGAKLKFPACGFDRGAKPRNCEGLCRKREVTRKVVAFRALTPVQTSRAAQLAPAFHQNWQQQQDSSFVRPAGLIPALRRLPRGTARCRSSFPWPSSSRDSFRVRVFPHFEFEVSAFKKRLAIAERHLAVAGWHGTRAYAALSADGRKGFHLCPWRS